MAILEDIKSAFAEAVVPPGNTPLRKVIEAWGRPIDAVLTEDQMEAEAVKADAVLDYMVKVVVAASSHEAVKIQERAEFPLPSRRVHQHHVAKSLQFSLAQFARDLRIEAVRLEELLRVDPDNDATRDTICRNFGEAEKRLSLCLNGYLLTRDIQGVG